MKNPIMRLRNCLLAVLFGCLAAPFLCSCSSDAEENVDLKSIRDCAELEVAEFSFHKIIVERSRVSALSISRISMGSCRSSRLGRRKRSAFSGVSIPRAHRRALSQSGSPGSGFSAPVYRFLNVCISVPHGESETGSRLRSPPPENRFRFTLWPCGCGGAPPGTPRHNR